jgi:hypothetical protein
LSIGESALPEIRRGIRPLIANDKYIAEVREDDFGRGSR